MYDLERPRPRHIATGVKWVIGSVALVMVVVMVIASMSIFGWGWFQRSTADFRGETAALEEILADPDRRITAYEHFFDLCASIQGHEDTIRALETELEGDPSESRAEQIQGVITVNQAQRDSKIRQYNSDASMEYTVGQFRDANLPHELDVSKEATTCTAR